MSRSVFMALCLYGAGLLLPTTLRREVGLQQQRPAPNIAHTESSHCLAINT